MMRFPKGIHWYLLHLPNHLLYLIGLFLLLLLLSYPIWKNWTLFQQIATLEARLASESALMLKQQQTLQHLQKRVSERQDTQKNTQKIATLHQQLTDLSDDTSIRFDMQMSNKDLLRVELHLYASFQDFIENFDLLFQVILADWAISSLRIERGAESDQLGVLHIAIHLFSEELRE
ncbi:hypothetical protein ACFFHK_04575 [Gallibacterium trehalosifermentans]|uniref:Competence protein C n=1 Tax=Gallibacterium trehalosifermentans TaxID=516935 RepID=A0ABV6H026_9PAST